MSVKIDKNIIGSMYIRARIWYRAYQAKDKAAEWLAKLRKGRIYCFHCNRYRKPFSDCCPKCGEFLIKL